MTHLDTSLSPRERKAYSLGFDFGFVAGFVFFVATSGISYVVWRFI